MFGLLQPCSRALDDDLSTQWRQHLCGLCLALRDDHGHAARLTTNTDAVMISILTAAQQDHEAQTTVAGRCPLRGMRRTEVRTGAESGIQLASTASLTLAAAKAYDVRAEQDFGLAPPSRIRGMVATAAAGTLRRRASARPTGLDVGAVLTTLSAQAGVETTGTSLADFTEPTARATAAVFAATADAADAPDNRELLAAIGHDFGTLAHILDAVDDRESDSANGSFNPLTASGTETGAALADCRRLAAAIRRRYERLHLVDDRLLRVVLLGGLRHAINQRTHHKAAHGCATAEHSPQPLEVGPAPEGWPDQRPADFPGDWPYPPPFPPDRGFTQRIWPFTSTLCSGRTCCTGHWNHCSDKWKGGCYEFAGSCDDCCDADCCKCCKCCDCCDCCDCS